MSAYEMMLSESQERMLMVLKPEKEKEAEAIFRKWGLDFAVVGETTPTRALRRPAWRRGRWPTCRSRNSATRRRCMTGPYVRRRKPQTLDAATTSRRRCRSPTRWRSCSAAPISARKRWVWEQYDHVILGNTVQRPGGDAAVVRVDDGPKGLALTADVTPRYCEADPFEGGKQAVAEAWRNITAVGAQAARAHRQSQFRQSGKAGDHGPVRRLPRGIGEACRALDFPVVSGNVSLYNETNGRAILPTPSIGGVGLVADFTKIGDARLQGRGRSDPADRRDRRAGSASRSICATSAAARRAPRRRSIWRPRERNGDFVRGLIGHGLRQRGA